MSHPTLQDTIRNAAETMDFHALFDRLADDVEYHVTVDITSSARSVRRGKQSVVDRLRGRDAAEAANIESPLEFFADGTRVVACRDGNFAIADGLIVRSERTVVFDVRRGSIARIGVHYDLTPSVEGEALPPGQRDLLRTAKRSP